LGAWEGYSEEIHLEKVNFHLQGEFGRGILKKYRNMKENM
jgi:hypothetical protein